MALFGKKINPMGAAMPYLNQVSDVGRQAYNPFIQQGQQAHGNTSPIYGEMASDPAAYLNSILSGYKPSQGYQFKQDQALKAARNSAASGGFAGTGYDQQRQAGLVNSLMGEDMQQFLQNVLGIQGAGLQGQEGAIGRGYQASGSLADLLGGNLNTQAGLAYGNAQQQNAQRMAVQKLLMQLVGTGLGAAAGGPVGAAAGGSLFSSLSGAGSGGPDYGGIQWQ